MLIEEVVEIDGLNQELEQLVSQFDEPITVADLIVEILFPDEDQISIPAGFSNLMIEAQKFLVTYALKMVLKQTKYKAGLVMDGLSSQFLANEVRSNYRNELPSVEHLDSHWKDNLMFCIVTTCSHQCRESTSIIPSLIGSR